MVTPVCHHKNKTIKQQDDFARTSYSQHVHRMSIMTAISVVLKLSLDNVNELSRHSRSSNSRALVCKST